MRINHQDPRAVAECAAMVLRTHPIMVVCTSDHDSRPWGVPVHQKTASDGVITWRSKPETRHSQNLAANPAASATLFSATKEAGEVSLFIDGTAKDIGVDPKDAELQSYQLTIDSAWVNDDNHIKTKVNLELLKEFLKGEQ